MAPWLTTLAAVPAAALGAYLWLIFVLRLTGKRSLSKLNAFDEQAYDLLYDVRLMGEPSNEPIEQRRRVLAEG